MPYAGKVLMESPDGSEKIWVDTGEVNHYRERGAKIAKVRLRSPYGQEREVQGGSAGRMLDAGAQFVEPGQEQSGVGLGGALRNVAQSTVAAAPGMAAQLAPMAIPGVGWGRMAGRLGLAFGAGAGGDAASRAIMGEPQQPMVSVLTGGANAAMQAPFEGAAMLPPAMAARFAKGALGSSRPDLPGELLRAGTPVSIEGMAADQAFISRKTALAQRAIHGVVGQARDFPLSPLENVVKEFRTRAKKYDLLSKGGEKGAEDALAIMDEKLRALEKTKQVPGARGGTKAQRLGRLKASDIDGINQYAESAVKKLFEARKANKISDPGQDELMYKRIADITNKMLNTIPVVERANAAASKRIDLKRAKFESLKRAEEKPTNPMAALLGLGQSPEAMSRMAAKFYNIPPELLIHAPRQVGVAATTSGLFTPKKGE